MMVVHVQPIVHYTFIPLIIVLGMTMTGKLTPRLSHSAAVHPVSGRSSLSGHPKLLFCIRCGCSLRKGPS